MVYDLSEVLKVEADGSVRVVTLNRPDALNAFDEALHAQFPRLWSYIEADTEVRAVVLTGAGRAFSAGGNLEDFEMFRTNFAARRVTLRQARRIVDELLNVHVPVVAAVNGPAVGLGATLASLCDAVFVADNTFFADSHVAVALVAGDGGAVTWPAHIGLLRAKRYLLTGDRVPAADAVQMGLATEAVPPEDVLSTAIAYAQRLAALPPQAVQETKAILNQHLRANAVRVLGYGLAAESQSHDTPEYAGVPEQLHRRK